MSDFGEVMGAVITFGFWVAVVVVSILVVAAFCVGRSF